MRRHRLAIDADEDCWFLRSSDDPLWTDTEMLEIEARRLCFLFPKLGNEVLLIRSSLNGWHLRFNKSRLTWPEMEAALCASKVEHFGHKMFSQLLKDDTIRVSRKPGKPVKPYLRKIIKIKKSGIRI